MHCFCVCVKLSPQENEKRTCSLSSLDSSSIRGSDQRSVLQRDNEETEEDAKSFYHRKDTTAAVPSFIIFIIWANNGRAELWADG